MAHLSERLVTLLIVGGSVMGCAARAHEDVHAATAEPMLSESAPPPIDREILAIDATPSDTPAGPPSNARPRLSQTVTLGQGTESQYTMSARPADGQGQPQAGGQPSVVVNNNYVVQNPPAFYGGYAGYGAYRSFGGYGRATTFRDGRSGGTTGNPQWGATGWEGARRTAAPGQTPSIGGNWAPVPSYGPAQMK